MLKREGRERERQRKNRQQQKRNIIWNVDGIRIKKKESERVGNFRNEMVTRQGYNC